MSKQTVRLRLQLFNLFAQNLSTVKKHSNIDMQPDIADTIVCPLCFRGFLRSSLDIGQVLTLEHVPPKVFGGQDSQGVLLCGQCNHATGSKLDRQIQIKLESDDLLQGIPGAAVDGRYSIGPNPSFVATLRIPAEGTIQIEGDGRRANPKEKAQELSYIEKSWSTEGLSGNISFSIGNRHLADIGLLRVAYLIAFRTLGYGFVFHSNIAQVKTQIANPNEHIIPRNWILPSGSFQEMPLGVNFVTQPNEFRSVLIIFELRSKSRTTRHVVVLPNTHYPGIGIYDWLARQKEGSKSLTFSGKHIAQDTALLLDPHLCFLSHRFWKE